MHRAAQQTSDCDPKLRLSDLQAMFVQTKTKRRTIRRLVELGLKAKA